MRGLYRHRLHSSFLLTVMQYLQHKGVPITQKDMLVSSGKSMQKLRGGGDSGGESVPDALTTPDMGLGVYTHVV